MVTVHHSVSNCVYSSYSCVQANLDVMGWEISAEDYNKLCSLSTQMRMVNGSFWLHPRGPYKSLKDLWDDDNDEVS